MMRMFWQLFGLCILCVTMWSCDDGAQRYNELKVEGDYFDVVTHQKGKMDSIPQVEEWTHGAIGHFGEAKTVYRMKKGTDFVLFRDEDWDRFSGYLFIIDGEVIAENADKSFVEVGISEGKLTVLNQGDINEARKDSMSLGEYQTFLRKYCPPKAKARSMAVWIGVLFVVFAVILAAGLFYTYDETEEQKRDPKRGAVTVAWGWVLLAVTLAIPAYTYYYFYANPNESLWFITDWGFLGFLVGGFFLSCVILIALAPLFMIGDAFKRMRDESVLKGLGELALCCGLCVLSYYFLTMLFGQIWGQCGFMIKSVGVLVVCIMLPGGIAGGFKSKSDSGPETIIDGNGGYHFVVGSDGDRVTTTDGGTWRKRADGNYERLH